MSLEVLDQGTLDEPRKCEYHYAATGKRCQNTAERWVQVRVEPGIEPTEAQCEEHFMGDTNAG